MQFLENLNPEQRRAVEHIYGPLLVNAGAGSGKTRVIVCRVAHLIEGGHAAPDQILAVTFTNKAAEEMRARVEGLLGGRAPWLGFSTFHAFCARLLRREAQEIGLATNFVIYDASDQLRVVKRILKDLASKAAPRWLLRRISGAKNRMLDIAALSDRPRSPQDELFVTVYDRYARALAAANALDFDDLLLNAVALLDGSASARHRYGERFRYVMVDEYQDTNRPQYLLMRQLAAHRNLCVVGDADQSIYTWRGADINNILQFERDFPDATVIRLERNYRSNQIILDAAAGLIRHNTRRLEKRLWTDRGSGERVLSFEAGDNYEEADGIVACVADALDRSTPTAAILYRTNAQSRVIEEALKRASTPYRIVGNLPFYRRPEIKIALCHLKLCVNPHDDESLRQVILASARGIGEGTIERLARSEPGQPPPVGDAAPPPDDSGDAPAPTVSLWARLERAVDDRLLPPRAHTLLSEFREYVTGLTATARPEGASATLSKVLASSGYTAKLREACTEEADNRLENLNELEAMARDYELRTANATLAGFVDQLSLMSEVDEEAGVPDAKVTLMTLHAAKGLEFPMVVIAGMEEGLLPHTRTTSDPAAIEEERRLCYVGMTRAQSRLVLTRARRRRTGREYVSAEPSRFLAEVPGHLVNTVALSRPPDAVLQAGQTWRGRRQQDASGKASHDERSARLLRPGMRVRHSHFGVGTVESVQPQGRDVMLSVRFEDVGQKQLLGSFARLVRV